MRPEKGIDSTIFPMLCRHVLKQAGFSVVREFVGHGIGRSLHEDPQLPNYGDKGTGIRLKAGNDFCHRTYGKYGEIAKYILKKMDGQRQRKTGAFQHILNIRWQSRITVPRY